MRSFLTFAASSGVLGLASVVLADTEPLYGQYWMTPAQFTRPSSEKFDVLPDGRILAVQQQKVFVESAVGSRSFTQIGSFSGLSSNSAAFVEVSPDGTKVAIGNNGGPTWSDYKIGVFNLSGFTGPSATVTGSVFDASHYIAIWNGNNKLIVSEGGQVVERDLGAGTSKTLVTTSASSGGVAIDSSGALYVGIGYDFNPADGDATGVIRRFTSAELVGAGAGGLNFNASGQFVADVLSADSLAFDKEGNLLVGGTDLFGAAQDMGYVGIINADALAGVIAGSLDPITQASPASEMRQLVGPLIDSDGATLTYNPYSDEIYVSNWKGATTGVIAIPEPAFAGLLVPALLSLRRRRS